MKHCNKVHIIAVILITILVCYSPAFSNEIIEIKEPTDCNTTEVTPLEPNLTTQATPVLRPTEKEAVQSNIESNPNPFELPTTVGNKPIVNADGSIMNTLGDNSDKTNTIIDKRQHTRFNINNITYPVYITKVENINKLIDISRGGIGVRHNNTVKVGEIIPVHIAYKDIVINTKVKIVSTTDNRAGAEFTDLNDDIANQLLYLSVLLEADNNMITNRINN